ncbi:MAG: endonuclease III [Clostridia bacterium]|nr:endonuclease III [Clostridia bacterium]
MTKKEKALIAVEILKSIYPKAPCALDHRYDPWRLLVMARLSAQCTDKRVNEVSVGLFSKYPDAKALAAAPLADIEELIFSCGLYKTKAKSLKECAKIVCEKFDGKVPQSEKELLSLPGIGRKIANLLLGELFSTPMIVADTHCIRISKKLGLASKADPLTAERELDKLIPKSEQVDFCHRLVQFGRDVCISRSPKCDVCPLWDICKEKNKQKKQVD